MVLKRLHTWANRHKSCSSKYEKIASNTSSGSSYCKYWAAVGPRKVLPTLGGESRAGSTLTGYKRRDRLRAGNMKLLASEPPIGSALQCCSGMELCTVGGCVSGAPVACVLLMGNDALVEGAWMTADDCVEVLDVLLLLQLGPEDGPTITPVVNVLPVVVCEYDDVDGTDDEDDEEGLELEDNTDVGHCS